MFSISAEYTFAAGHALRGYRGKCENVHGHNYRIVVRLEGAELDAIGLLCDFTDLKAWMREISEQLDHQYLNDLEPFRTLNPSAENLARYFYQQLRQRAGAALPHTRLAEVTVFETDVTSASYRED